MKGIADMSLLYLKQWFTQHLCQFFTLHRLYICTAHYPGLETAVEKKAQAASEQERSL